MSQHEYKVGDRVRYVRSSFRLPYGSVGTVVKIHHDEPALTVMWDNFTMGHDGDMGYPRRVDYWFAATSEVRPTDVNGVDHG